jgi:CRP-like cAMP-binding protein
MTDTHNSTSRDEVTLGFLTRERLTLLLQANDETEAQEQVRACITEIFLDLDPITAIKVAGELIEYFRDYVLSGMATVRRAATVTARITMTPDDIAKATGLSRPTVSRLITEHREP